jgi:hypothetical protein
MRSLGLVVVAAGVIGIIAAMSMDTSVAVGDVDVPSSLRAYVPSGMSSMRVNNLGRMQEKQNYLILSGLGLLVGVVLMLAGRGREEEEQIQVRLPLSGNLDRNEPSEQRRITAGPGPRTKEIRRG